MTIYGTFKIFSWRQIHFEIHRGTVVTIMRTDLNNRQEDKTRIKVSIKTIYLVVIFEVFIEINDTWLW